MKYCEKCGKELMDEAVICTGCGCPVKAEVQPVAEKSTKPKKPLWFKIVISVVAVILVAAIAVGGFFAVNLIRVNQVKDQLAGKTFRFNKTAYDTRTEAVYKFDYNANVKYTYEFNMYDVDYHRTHDDEYEYEVYFENGMTFLKIGSYVILEVQYDRYGNIESLYDTITKELYERN